MPLRIATRLQRAIVKHEIDCPLPAQLLGLRPLPVAVGAPLRVEQFVREAQLAVDRVTQPRHLSRHLHAPDLAWPHARHRLVKRGDAITGAEYKLIRLVAC